MNPQNELNALLHLIDDPDNEIYEVVSDRIITYGAPIIPSLEHLWENTANSDLQERIEMLIHRCHFSTLITDFKDWNEAGHHELMPALLLVSKFLFPDLQSAKVLHNIDRLKRNIWLEINNYLTPLEQVNIINSILYNYFGVQGNYNNNERPYEFLIPNILESKKGNQTGIGSLYLLLVEMLDIPVRLLPIPHQFVLGYCKPASGSGTATDVSFFLEPATGQVFTHTDLQHYLSKISLSPHDETYLKPQNNRQVIQKVLTDFKQCYSNDNQKIQHSELDRLIQLLD